MLTTASALQLQLRETEEALAFADARVELEGKSCECVLVLVRSKTASHEAALFVFKRGRVLGRLKAVQAYPVVQELVVRLLDAQEFHIMWLDYEPTRLVGVCPDKSFLQQLQRHRAETAGYQRESFSSKASSHRWLWYYEAIVSAYIRDPQFNQGLLEKDTVPLLPEHYGREPMQAFVQLQLATRAGEYTQHRTISGFAGTWNCGGTSPSASLVPWLRAVETPELVVLGLQEMCKLTASNLLGNEERTQQWTTFLISEVQAAYGVSYRVIDVKALVGLLLVTLIREDLKDLVNPKSISSCSVKLGCHGAVGNKGAVSTSFTLGDTTLCIVNCHLAPFKNYFQERNDHIHRILEKLKFPPNIGVYEHDLVLWLGDLNYRLDNIPAKRIEALISSKSFLELSHYDQLLLARDQQLALLEFQEAPLNFQPSYKFIPNSCEYYYGQGEKKREPSWCDRVLWRGELDALTYTSFADLSQSDHKPVLLAFTTPVKHINQAVLKEITAQIYAEIDISHLNSMPRLKLSTTLLHFTQTKYRQPQTLPLILTNESDKKVSFRFRNENECKLMGRWVSVTPTNGSINAKDSLQLEFSVLLTHIHLQKAAASSAYLSCMFVLSVEEGSDHFVEVKCDALLSAFGVAIEDLRRIASPIRTIGASIKETVKLSTVELPIPKELWRLMDFIVGNGQTNSDLFACAGDVEQEQYVRESLDTGTAFDAHTSVLAVCSVLVEFLLALPTPLVPADVLDSSCLDYLKEARRRTDLAQCFVKHLPEPYTFLALMSMLRALPKPCVETALPVLTEALTQADNKQLTGRELQLVRMQRICFLGLFV